MNSTQKKKVIKPLYTHWNKLSNDKLREILLDFKQWCEQGKLIINKKGHAVPFLLNEAQEEVAKLILSKAFAPIPEPIALVIHKSRQMGISVVLAALEQYLVDRKQNLNITHLLPDEQLAYQFFNEKWQPLAEGTHPQLLPDMYPTLSPVPYIKVGDFHGRNMNCNIKIGGAGSPAAGRSGALANDTPVPTPYGWTTHGELKVGDSIFGGDGKVAKVTYVKPERHTQLYKVKLSDGSSLEADDEHLWECIIRRGSREGRPPKHHTLTTLQIKERLSLGKETLVPVHKSVSYTHKELPIDSYKLGLLLGDGSIDEKGRPTFCSMDEELILNFDGHRRVNKGLFEIFPKGFAPALRKLGLAGHRSYEKFIPKDYLQSSEEQRTALLQGLMDTDGYWSKVDNRGGLTTTSKELAYGVKELVMSLGGHCSVRYYDTVGRVSSSGVISRHGEYKVNIRVWFNPFRLERKKSIWSKPQDKKYLTVKSVEPTRVDWCKCIEVDNPTHTYLAGEDFMVTHNTQHVVILDEYAFYSNVSSLERGILATQPKTGMVLTVYVSTANGMNWFYDTVKQAESPNSRMEHLFLPWHMLKEYEMEIKPGSRFYDLDLYKPTEYDMKLMDIFEKQGYPEECWLNKMEWYDYVLDKEAKGDRDYMFQEYPSTPEESFEVTGRPCLPAKVINYWLEKTQSEIPVFVDQYSQPDPRTHRPKITIQQTNKSAVRMWKKPVPGHRYLLGCDPSEGDYAGDRSAWVIVDTTTMDEVCFSADYLEAEELADTIINYARFYNNAVIVVERNMGQAVIEFLKASGYHRIYVDPNTRGLKYGVRTTQATKNEALRRLRFLLNNGLYKPHDMLFLEEAQHFSWRQLPGGSWRVEAMGTDADGQPYHDDTIMARAVLSLALDMRKFKGYYGMDKPTKSM